MKKGWNPIGVFINHPFDREYQPILEIITFTVIACGFVPKTAALFKDSGEVRLQKILNLIRSCKYGIHDLSRIEVSSAGLPRYNMPFELGLDLGCRYSGINIFTQKRNLILEKKEYRYQKFLSDISGQDIHAHEGKPDLALIAVRDWLEASSKRKTIPGPSHIRKKYRNFQLALPELKSKHGYQRHKKIPYHKYVQFAVGWMVSE